MRNAVKYVKILAQEKESACLESLSDPAGMNATFCSLLSPSFS
jgi:hypothetical protein